MAKLAKSASHKIAGRRGSKRGREGGQNPPSARHSHCPKVKREAKGHQKRKGRGGEMKPREGEEKKRKGKKAGEEGGPLADGQKKFF
jgi:hypothetical protein